MLKELNNISGIEYTDWEPLQIKSAFIREYFSVGYNKGSKKQFAWYNLPIFSDSPICKFIKFLRYTDNYREQLLPLFNKVVKQELGRISKVLQRRKLYASPISNYDKNGDKFHFFPELNDGNFLQEAGELIADEDFEGLDKLINTRLEEIMDANFEEFLNTNFTDTSYESLKQSLLSDGVITSESQFEDALEEYFWNQAYATTQIIELTTTDLAFYKDDVDFQKRYKEVYAAGTKLNTNTQYGKKTEKTLYLTDQIITSSGYQDIRKSLNRAVKLGHIQSFDRDNILDKFKNINVADAQAYRSLKSLRAVLDMMGAWTPEMQESFDRFESGNWDMSDFNRVWQTIKPFVFTQIEKPDGLGGSIKVPHQNKNSEFLLLSMYSMIAGATGKSAKLQAINRFMDDHDIDVVQFESAVKAGGQGKIDLSYSPSKLSDWMDNLLARQLAQLEDAAEKALGKDYAKASDFERFKAGNDYLLDHDQISQEEYNDRFEAIEPSEEEVYDILEKYSLDEDGDFIPEVIHEIPYTDYMIQQPTPEHLFDHKAVFGSQFRNLIISDMPDDPNFRVKVNGKELTKQQVINLYQSNIVENLLDDWRKVKGKFANIEALQKDTVRGTSKFGRDMLSALQIVTITNPLTMKEEKVFNIPLDNPSTTLKIQELITSMFKNAITKQDIKGGACILVSNFGLTKELNIIHGDDGSIQGIECYLPAYSKQFYEPLMTKADDGSYYLDVEKLPMDLRKIIGYRIPTEDKYSMAPLIIKGFLPQQNGSAIMLPADITQIAGSDFDVDKMFLMIPEFKVHKYDMRRAREDYAKVNSAFKEALSIFTNSELLQDTIDVDEKSGFKTWFSENKSKYEYETPKIVKVKYDMSKRPQEQSREARNNMLIDIAWGILTNPDTAEKIHNPGSFDKAKIAARIASIVRDPKMVSDFAQAYGIIPAQEEGLIKIYPELEEAISDQANYGNKTITGNFVILRSSSKDNYHTWQEVRRFRLSGEIPHNRIFYDYTVEQGIKYRYAIQQYNRQHFYSKKIYSYKRNPLNGEILYNQGQPILNEIKADFEDMFLYDGKRQLKIRFNPQVTSFKNDLQEQKIDTIGSKHPFIFRNGNICYKEFPISGLISFQLDNAKFFINDEDYKQMDLSRFELENKKRDKDSYITYKQIEWKSDLETAINNNVPLYQEINQTVTVLEQFGHENLVSKNHFLTQEEKDILLQKENTLKQNIKKYSLIDTYAKAVELFNNKVKIYRKLENIIVDPITNARQNIDYVDANIYSKTDLTSENITTERYFKLLVLDWLTDGKPKLFRSPTEGNYIVRLLNVNLSPKAELGRMIHEFTCTAYEIADFNYQNLLDLGLLTIESFNEIEKQWFSKDIRDLFKSNNKNSEGYYTLDLGNKNIVGLQCTGFEPGDIIQIMIKDSATPLEILIGTTGTYIYDEGVPIIGVSILPLHDEGNFSRNITLAAQGYSYQPFDTIASISTYTQAGDQLVGPVKDFLKQMVVGIGNYSASPNVVLFDNTNIKLRVSEILHLHAKRREIIPIFYNERTSQTGASVIIAGKNDMPKFSLTPFGQGYIRGKSIMPASKISWITGNLSHEELEQSRSIKELVDFVISKCNKDFFEYFLFI